MAGSGSKKFRQRAGRPIGERSRPTHNRVPVQRPIDQRSQGEVTRATEVHDRTICRRAERMMVELAAQPDEPVNQAGIQYMNRLSDFLFVASRFLNNKGAGDVLWVPGQNR